MEGKGIYPSHTASYSFFFEDSLISSFCLSRLFHFSYDNLIDEGKLPKTRIKSFKDLHPAIPSKNPMHQFLVQIMLLISLNNPLKHQ